MSDNTEDEDVTICPEDLGEPGATTTGVKRKSKGETQSDD